MGTEDAVTARELTVAKLFRVLSTSKDPAEVNELLVLLLKTLTKEPTGAGLLTPVMLNQLLRILVENIGDAWLEVRKKIAFVFSDLLSTETGDALSDALLYGCPQSVASSGCQPSRIAFSDEDKETVDPSIALKRMKGILGSLAEAHGTVERCVPAADVFRTLVRLPAVLELVVSPKELLAEDDKAATSTGKQQVKRYRFEKSCIGILCRSATAYTTALCTETWRSLITALCANKSLSSPLLLYYFDEFVEMFLSCLTGKNFVAQLHALELITAILEDASFLKARPKFAESPALLCALLPLTSARSNHIRFLTFDAIKVFIAKGNKPAPIRYVLYINRETLARYVEDYSTDESSINQLLSLEKQKIMQSLLSLEPLSHEEELLLGVS